MQTEFVYCKPALGDTLLLTHLGYTSKKVIVTGKEMKVCLSPQIIHLAEVKVNSKAINYYDTLMLVTRK